MEYVQMTLDDWIETKAKLKAELLGIRRSFVRIGYFLRTIDESRGYEKDGYKSITEFAKGEYGLEASTVSRMIAINREYSIDGFSEQLLPEYEDFRRTQLEEMLQLPPEDRKMITADTPRSDIRELKEFNRSEPETGVADDIKQLLENFFEENNSLIREIIGMDFAEDTIKGFVEIVNPSGNRSYKKGLFFLMMYEDKVVIKKFGSSPQNMTWWEFYQISKDILDDFKAPDEKEEPVVKEDPLPVEEKIEVAEAETEEETEEETEDDTEGEAEEETEDDTKGEAEEEAEEEAAGEAKGKAEKPELPAVAPAQISKEEKEPKPVMNEQHVYTVQFKCYADEYEKLARWARTTGIKFKKIGVR